MRLTALQLPARFDAFNAQVALAEALLEQGPATDLVLLPETAFTGYVSPRGEFDLTRFAEPLEGRAHHALRHLAQRFDALVVGPVIERAEGACFNTLLGVGPDGARVLHYRKHHPWYPETWATPGEGPAGVTSWRGARLTCAVCFDVHFLATEASEALRHSELLLYPSAWVDDGAGEDARPGHLAALARAFKVPSLNANWGAGTPAVHGQGGTLAMRSDGTVAARLGAGPGRLDVMLSSLRAGEDGL